MESQYICSECGCEHDEPSEATLGHRVICLDCAMTLEAVTAFESAAFRSAVRREAKAPTPIGDVPPMAA